MPALVPFIRDELCRDEQFVYIADDQTVEELEGQLQQNGIDVSQECKRGALNLRKALLRNDYNVLVASHEAQAVDLYHRRKGDISVVLLDVALPKTAGLDVILRMKEENPDVKVIVASGYIDPDFKLKLQRVYVQGFIEKPYSPDDVICMLRDSLEGSPDSPSPSAFAST